MNLRIDEEAIIKEHLIKISMSPDVKAEFIREVNIFWDEVIHPDDKKYAAMKAKYPVIVETLANIRSLG